MRESRSYVAILAALVLLLLMSANDSLAQKKKAPAKSTPTATQQSTTPAPPPAGKQGGTIKDLLVKYKGQLTTLGVLKQVEWDYFVVEEDGAEIIHPISDIKSIKIMKIEKEPADEEKSDEESEEESEEELPKLDIRLR
ncbi:MAG: hypothetical protein H6Q32_37 [Bacteroidetes bacterium]|nr:hypothetical protein [Bacteroidota bacterium]